MWTYTQATGELFNPSGELAGVGYSGAPGHVNDPGAEQLHGIGPCPRGLYTFGPAHDDGHLGKDVMDLTPVAPFDAFGRSLLRMHGDNAKRDRSASQGCIVLDHEPRAGVAASDDRLILVV